MGWFISIMTPFWVTRQFHCPEGFFFLCCATGWRLLWKGGNADGMASNKSGAGGGGGGFSKHTSNPLVWLCQLKGVQYREGMRQSHFPTGEKDTGSEFTFFSFLFWRSYCWVLSLKIYNTFWFSSFPLILTNKSAMWLHICISLFAHQKALQSDHQLGSLHGISKNILLLEPQITSRHSLCPKGFGVNVTKSCTEGISGHFLQQP